MEFQVELLDMTWVLHYAGASIRVDYDSEPNSTCWTRYRTTAGPGAWSSWLLAHGPGDGKRQHLVTNTATPSTQYDVQVKVQPPGGSEEIHPGDNRVYRVTTGDGVGVGTYDGDFDMG